MIHNGQWKTEADRDTLANEVVIQHDNLQSAYDALGFLALRPEYHDHIIKMVLRDGDYQRKIERALYALATYRRKTDVSLIKESLLLHRSRFTAASFLLMDNYPDTAYLEVLEGYYPGRYFRSFRETNYIDVVAGYIDALASYKTDTCAKILTAIPSAGGKPVLPTEGQITSFTPPAAPSSDSPSRPAPTRTLPSTTPRKAPLRPPPEKQSIPH